MSDMFENLTEEKCLELIRFNAGYFNKLAKELRTPRVCLELVMKYPGMAINLSEEELIEVVKLSGGNILWYLQERCMTPAVCLAAVQQNGLVARFLTMQQLTPEICLAAVQQNINAMLLLSREQINKLPKVYHK